jgi:hypothetical protein
MNYRTHFAAGFDTRANALLALLLKRRAALERPASPARKRE